MLHPEGRFSRATGADSGEQDKLRVTSRRKLGSWVAKTVGQLQGDEGNALFL